MIDLRSDTVTRPSSAMRTAMARAEVGDDVFGEDPTVNRLEARVAEMLGKETAVFVPSGTMANQIALHALTRPGDVVLAGEGCHVLRYESGAASVVSGLQIETLGRGGFFSSEDVLGAIAPVDPHRAPTTVVAVENTHNVAGGRIFPLEALRDVARAARDRGLALHLDGARLWNAAVASGVPEATWAEPFDTVACCLSKGLGAPVGSLVCGPAALTPRLRRARKMLGGGMRQAGVLAAAGLHALDQNRDRLARDHANAELLAKGLADLGIAVERPPETNIVMFQWPDAAALVRACAERGVLLIPFAESRVRAVTHLDVTEEDVAAALGRMGEAIDALRRD